MLLCWVIKPLHLTCRDQKWYNNLKTIQNATCEPIIGTILSIAALPCLFDKSILSYVVLAGFDVALFLIFILSHYCIASHDSWLCSFADFHIFLIQSFSHVTLNTKPYENHRTNHAIYFNTKQNCLMYLLNWSSYDSPKRVSSDLF